MLIICYCSATSDNFRGFRDFLSFFGIFSDFSDFSAVFMNVEHTSFFPSDMPSV